MAEMEFSDEEDLEQEPYTEELPEGMALDFDRLDAFGASLAKTCSEDIAYRQASGIEQIWEEDEEFYEGVDDLNRAEESTTMGHRRQKPSANGQSTDTGQTVTRSTVFPNITAPFVDAAVARLGDVLLPPLSTPSWNLTSTPIPELMGAAAGDFPEVPDIDYDDPQAIQQQAENENALMNEAKRQIEEAKQKAENAKRRIHDWHVECNRNAQARLAIADGGRIGVGVLKCPYPKVKKRIGYLNGKVETIIKVNPATKWVDPWNFFPSKDCGENIHNGPHVWERDYISSKQLREFMDDPSYIPEQILACLAEGPHRATDSASTPPTMDQLNSQQYEIWYWHGTAEREDLEAGGCDCTDMEDPHVPAMITMVNDRVIRASLNPLDTGQYPYGVFTWRKRRGHWAGIGVARQVRTAQRIVVGGTRNLMDNAGVAAGPMLVFRQNAVVPANGVARFEPRKIWYITEDADAMQDATKAIGAVKVDMMVDDLMKIIQFGMKLAEDTTGLPMLLQGQMGNAPDTVGGMKLLYNNTAAPLRRLARNFDNQITEGEIERYYVWLLLYGENDDEKGDFFIEATGSSTLVERDLQEQELGQMGSIVIDPRFGKDPKKWMDEWLKSRRFDPENFDYDDEEWQKVVEGMANPPPDPALEVAQIRAQADLQKTQITAGTRLTEEQMKHEVAVWMAQNQNAENDMERQIKLILAGATEETTMGKSGADREKQQDKIAADMAALVMKLRAQERLAGMQAVSDRMPMEAPSEPPGKAETGKSIQQ